jgi:DNA repair protein RecO (recombination protein O)
MAPTKTRAVVLKVLPYRESSYIVHLFTESHGLLHGIAKGMRKAKAGQSFLERGFLVELLAYVRPQRELHTLGSIQVLEFCPGTRSSLLKSAVRDAAFELVLSAVRVTDPHPELFAFFQEVLLEIERREDRRVYPWTLWAFYYRFAAMLGFALDLDRCARCGRSIGAGKAFVNVGRGALECERCSPSRPEARLLHGAPMRFLRGEESETAEDADLPAGEKKRLTRLLADYCRYHFDVRAESKALDFLEGLVCR